MGFNKDTSMKTDKAVNAFFAPEFRNRLSAVVAFNPLKLDALVEIVERELERLNRLLLSRQISVTVRSNAKQYLAKEGYDERYGARHIARVIDEKIKEALTDEILFGKLKKGGTAKVGFKNGQLTFDFDK